MNYFMKDLDPVADGLLEGSGPGASHPATPSNQASINGIVKDMLKSGYNPTKNKVQAIADMQAVNIPQDIIDQILGLAGKKTTERQFSTC